MFNSAPRAAVRGHWLRSIELSDTQSRPRDARFEVRGTSLLQGQLAIDADEKRLREASPKPARVRLSAEGIHRRPLLDLNVEGIHVICHFFTPDEIEFDIDTRDVKGDSEIAALQEFMRRLGCAVGRPVLLTPGNMHALPAIVYSPADDSFTCTP